MTNSDDPAVPELSTSWHDTRDGMTSYSTNGGLTKREHFAAVALQGLLADCHALRKDGIRDSEFAEFAVMQADWLLAALRATPTVNGDSATVTQDSHHE